MVKEQHHEELIEGISEQLKPILASSEQGVFVYLDDTHKVCNKKFASLLGYKSPEEWAKVESPLDENVAEKSQEILAKTYHQAKEKMIGSVIGDY